MPTEVRAKRRRLDAVSLVAREVLDGGLERLAVLRRFDAPREPRERLRERFQIGRLGVIQRDDDGVFRDARETERVTRLSHVHRTGGELEVARLLVRERVHDPARDFQKPRRRDRVQILHDHGEHDRRPGAIERQRHSFPDGVIQQTLEPREVRHENLAHAHEHVPDAHPGVFARAARRGILDGERARALDARRVLAFSFLHVAQSPLRLEAQAHATQIIEAAIRERRLQSSARNLRREPRRVDGKTFFRLRRLRLNRSALLEQFERSRDSVQRQVIRGRPFVFASRVERDGVAVFVHHR